MTVGLGFRLLLLAAVLGGTACGAVRPPVRSPLAEPTLTGTVPTSTSAPIGTSTPPTGAGTAAAGGAAEAATARAIALMAEWLAVPQRELAVTFVQALTWPSACPGTPRPGDICAAVQTPGYRIVLRDGLGGLHSVNSIATGAAARWAGEVRAQGRLTAFDRGGQRAEVATDDGKSLVLRLAPGTLAPTDLRVGAPVVASYDPAPNANGLAIAAWILPSQ